MANGRTATRPHLPCPGATRLAAWTAGILCTVVIGTGCTQTPSQPKVVDIQRRPDPAVSTTTDPCAMKLHEIAGPLLLAATRSALPQRLEDLRRVPGLADVGELACPESKRPYIYVPDGIPGPEPGSNVVLYDATPAHWNMRWAIIIIEGQGGLAPTAKVVALPESFFGPTPKP